MLLQRSAQSIEWQCSRKQMLAFREAPRLRSRLGRGQVKAKLLADGILSNNRNSQWTGDFAQPCFLLLGAINDRRDLGEVHRNEVLVIIVGLIGPAGNERRELAVVETADNNPQYAAVP